VSSLEDYKDISDADLLVRKNRFVAEGRMVVRRAIDRGLTLQSLLVNAAAHRDMADVIARLPDPSIVLESTSDELRWVTGFDFHRGCLAMVERPPEPTLDQFCATNGVIVVLETVGNADNVGSVFRNAAAFGAGGVMLSPGCCDPLYRKAVRTSMGAVLDVPFIRAVAWPATLEALRGRGFTVVAMTPREPSEALETFAARPRPERFALVVGTEGAGVSADVEAIADARVRIPIAERVDSLNLGVAVGIALYRLTNGR
jgi:tRNA G18 (ribose-2'-O)-methylase SpoU